MHEIGFLNNLIPNVLRSTAARIEMDLRVDASLCVDLGSTGKMTSRRESVRRG